MPLTEKRGYELVVNILGQNAHFHARPFRRILLREKPIGGKTTVAFDDLHRATLDDQRIDKTAVLLDVLNEGTNVLHVLKMILYLLLTRTLAFFAHNGVDTWIVQKEP